MTNESHSPSICTNTRGLLVESAGCALKRLFVANTVSGRCKLSTKQATVVGLGRALSSWTASSLVRGVALTPTGAWQRCSGAVELSGAEPSGLELAGAELSGSAPQPAPSVAKSRSSGLHEYRPG